jgi:hypothetical protein
LKVLAWEGGREGGREGGDLGMDEIRLDGGFHFGDEEGSELRKVA